MSDNGAGAARSPSTRRLGQTVRDMVLSMALVGFVVLIVAAPWRRVDTNVPTVEWRPVAVAFAGEASWPVLVPATQPSGWRSTSARIEPSGDGRSHLYLGFLTSSNTFISLTQSDTADVSFVSGATFDGAPRGTTRLGVAEWERRETTDRSTRSLVRADGPVHYIVVGSAPWEVLEGFAAGLVRQT